MADEAKFLFSAKPTWKSVLIRWLTGCRWSHVDLIDPDNEDYVIGSTGKKGVHRIKLTSRLPKGATGAIVTVPNLSGKAVQSVIEAHIGDQYDYAGLARFIFPWHDEDPNRFFCSELIAWGILSVRPDFPVLRKLFPYEATPADIWHAVRSELLTEQICYINGK